MNNLEKYQSYLDYFDELNKKLYDIIGNELNKKLYDIIGKNKTKMDEIWDDMNEICLKKGICINCRKKKEGTNYSICVDCYVNNSFKSYEDCKYWR